MRRKPRCQPQLESMESMKLLSAFSIGSHYPAAEFKTDGTPKTSAIMALNGSLRGTYQTVPGIPDAGTEFTFSTTGTVRPLGAATVTGNIHQLGFVANGRAQGVFVIETPQGTLTLKLEGPKQKGFAPLPDHYSFQITGASGAYHRNHGRGVLILLLQPATAGANHGNVVIGLVS